MNLSFSQVWVGLAKEYFGRRKKTKNRLGQRNKGGGETWPPSNDSDFLGYYLVAGIDEVFTLAGK